MSARAPLRVRISRTEAGAPSDFTIERRGLRVVLDVLAAIERIDPSLGYRYSCRSGLCGTCTVESDGRPGLACQTPLDPGARRITLAPLGGSPVVRDLIVDPAPFAERWLVAGTASGSPTPEAATHLDCISCGACTAACDMWSADRPFLGPAALTRAFVVLSSGPATARTEEAGPVGAAGLNGTVGAVRSVGATNPDGEAGPDGCHGIGACTLACPKHLDPSLAVRRLRRALLVGAGS